METETETTRQRETETAAGLQTGARSETETGLQTARETGDRETETAARSAAPRHAARSSELERDRETGTAKTETGPKPIGRGLALLINFSVWGLSGIATYVAVRGQVRHAEKEGVVTHERFLFPAALELTAISLILLGYAQARRGKSPWSLWVPAMGVGAWAVKLQLDNGGVTGQLFASCTVAALALCFIKLAGDYRTYLEDQDQGGLGLLWLTNPRLAIRAVLIKARVPLVRHTSTRIMFAEVWIAVYDDAKDAKDAKGAQVKLGSRMRRRLAWRTVLASANQPIADLPSMASVQRVSVVDRPAPVIEPAPPAKPAAHTVDEVEAIVNGPSAPRTPRTRQQQPVPVSPAPAGSSKVDPDAAKLTALAAIEGLPRIEDQDLLARTIKDALYVLKVREHLGAEMWTRPEPVSGKGDIKRATGIGGAETLKRLGQLIADLRALYQQQHPKESA